MFTAEFDGERILKIGQHLPKLVTRVGCPVFFTHGVYQFNEILDDTVYLRRPSCASKI